MKRWLFLSAAGALAASAMTVAHAQSAVARLEPTKGNATAGTVTFTQKGDKVAVEAKVSGLPRAATVFISTKKAIAARETE